MVNHVYNSQMKAKPKRKSAAPIGRARKAVKRGKGKVKAITGQVSDQNFGARTYAGGQTQSFGQLNQGGVWNPSGLGSGIDKGDGTIFIPTRAYSRHEFETLYVQSWAARSFINIPVHDMFIRWRDFTSDNDAANEMMMEAELEYDVAERLTRAMIAGRLYGTGVLLLMTREAPLDTPLNINRIQKGDLISLLAFDRWDINIIERDYDPFSPGYGSPVKYFVQPKEGHSFDIHASRVLRFDGIMPPSQSNWSSFYDQDWGVSEILPVIRSIAQDSAIAGGITHLTQEASVGIFKIQGLKNALTGAVLGPDESSVEQIASDISRRLSIFNKIFMDSGDNFERVAVQWAGLPDLLNVFQQRLAAAAHIPATRFLGRSPVGLNATGESDMVNYAMMVSAMQKRMLTKPLKKLDMILSRNAGMSDPPTYDFNSLIDMSDKEIADTDKVMADTATLISQVVDENAAIEYLQGRKQFSHIEKLPEEELEKNQPEPEPPVLPDPKMPPGGQPDPVGKSK